jgi:hypothetical protein
MTNRAEGDTAATLSGDLGQWALAAAEMASHGRIFFASASMREIGSQYWAVPEGRLARNDAS